MPPLAGPRVDVVDDAVPLERLHRAVVHPHRHRDLDALLAVREDLDQVRVDVERLADAAKLGLGELERVLAEVRRSRLGQRSSSGSRRRSRRADVYVAAGSGSPDVNGTICSSVAPRRRRGRRRGATEYVPGGSCAAARAAPGDAERVAPGQQVADAREPSRGSCSPWNSSICSCSSGSSCGRSAVPSTRPATTVSTAGLGVGRSERRLREPRAPGSAACAGGHGDRPRTRNACRRAP